MRHAPPRQETALERLGRLVARRRYVVLAATLALLVAAAVVAGGAVSRLSGGGLTNPGAESSQASDLLEQRFGGGEPNYLLLVTALKGGVDDPAVVAAGTDVTDRLAAHQGVERVVASWASGSPAGLRSTDGKSVLVLARLSGDEAEVARTAGRLTDDLAGSTDLLRVQAGGSGEVDRETGAGAVAGVRRAGTVALPLAFVALIVVLGAVVAAALPVGIGVVSVLGAVLVLAAVTALTDVPVLALGLTTALGLGLAVGYGLIVVSRYRDELRAGREPADALAATVGSAGRTLVLSALAAALPLSALLVLPVPLLRGFACAGIPVVLVAAAAAVVVLPALLAVLGHRVELLPVRGSERAAARHGRQRRSGGGRVARLCARRPVPVAVAGVAALLLLAAPFLQVTVGGADDPSPPPGSHGAAVRTVLREAFPSREADPLTVVSRTTLPTVELLPYASALSSLPDVARVDTAQGSFVDGLRVTVAGPRALADGEGTWVSVVPVVEPSSERGAALVHAVRDLPAPAHVLVGGSAARLVDTKAAVLDALPWALLVLVLSVWTLLYVVTGSALLPVRAIAVSGLGLVATLGMVVWGSQEGHLDSLAGVVAEAGTSGAAILVLTSCLALGLALGHEVIALSRVRGTGNGAGEGAAAMAAAVQQTGWIVRSAAVLVSIALLPLVTSGIPSLRLIAAGLTVAVVVDATLVRAFLVPAVTQLAGPAHRWEPARRGSSERFGRFAPRGEPAGGGTRHEPEPDVPAADPAWFAALAAGTRQPLAATAPD